VLGARPCGWNCSLVRSYRRQVHRQLVVLTPYFTMMVAVPVTLPLGRLLDLAVEKQKKERGITRRPIGMP